MAISATSWRAGAAEVVITPSGRPYLAGYPGADRRAEGVHDALCASAIVLDDGVSRAAIVSCDLLYLPGDLADRARSRLAVELGCPSSNIMLAATHTHSGPLTVRLVTHDADPTLPRPDADYLERLEERIVEAGRRARETLEPATLDHAIADTPDLGGNRRDPTGPRLTRTPVLVARGARDGKAIAVLAVCAMHPTVLHEDWWQISGDFPGQARARLQTGGGDFVCPFVYLMGASGNQSPRHWVKGNTMAEALRLGDHLADRIAAAARDARPVGASRIVCVETLVELPRIEPPTIEAAQRAEREAYRAWRDSQRRSDDPATVRTAEVDWFGRRKALALAEASMSGRLDAAIRQRSPASVQVLMLGDVPIVGWPGEVFVEFGLEVIAHDPRAAVVTLANGELHGYLVTQEAVRLGGYEASHALFKSPQSGDRLVEATQRLLDTLARRSTRRGRSIDGA